jgi:hypothetical protein
MRRQPNMNVALERQSENLVTLNEQPQCQAQQSLHGSKQLYCPYRIVIVVLDAERRIQYCTVSAQRLLRIRLGEVGVPIGDLRIGSSIPDLNNLISSASAPAYPATVCACAMYTWMASARRFAAQPGLRA